MSCLRKPLQHHAGSAFFATPPSRHGLTDGVAFVVGKVHGRCFSAGVDAKLDGGIFGQQVGDFLSFRQAGERFCSCGTTTIIG